MPTTTKVLNNIPHDEVIQAVEAIIERNAGVPKGAKPGDILEFPRLKGYSHYALYLGYGKVMDIDHIITEKDTFSEARAFIRARLVGEVAKGSRVYVKNHDDHGKPPLPPHEILKRALQYENKWVEYNLLYQNCEHLSTSWRYGGYGFSTQVAQPLKTRVGRNVVVGLMTFVVASGYKIMSMSESKAEKTRLEDLEREKRRKEKELQNEILQKILNTAYVLYKTVFKF